VSTPATPSQAQPEDILTVVAKNAYVSQAGIARELNMSAGWVSKQVRDLTGQVSLTQV
jgi:DNA-binding Lrp family transcriptional regulator